MSESQYPSVSKESVTNLTQYPHSWCLGKTSETQELMKDGLKSGSKNWPTRTPTSEKRCQSIWSSIDIQPVISLDQRPKKDIYDTATRHVKTSKMWDRKTNIFRKEVKCSIQRGPTLLDKCGRILGTDRNSFTTRGWTLTDESKKISKRTSHNNTHQLRTHSTNKCW